MREESSSFILSVRNEKAKEVSLGNQPSTKSPETLIRQLRTCPGKSNSETPATLHLIR